MFRSYEGSAYPFLGFAIFLVLLVVPLLPAHPEDGNPTLQNSAEATVFPVSRYLQRNPNQTGNNNYYALARRPGTKQMAVGASGTEDLLLYQDHSFKISRIDPLLYHRDAEWKNPGSLFLASSRTPPDTGGAIMRYDRADARFHVVHKTPLNLLSMTFANDRILAVGGQRYPQRAGAFYRISKHDIEKLPRPKSVVFHTIDWNPQNEQALIGGENGTFFLWDSSDTYEKQTIPGSPLIKSIDWHPDGNRALLAGDRGRIYRYRDGQITRIVTEFDWTVQDIAWHPDGEYALLVGGTGRSDQGYWARYEDSAVEPHSLSKPFFSVEWLDEDNALFGGQKVLWQYSESTDPDNIGLRASLSVSHRDPSVKQKITLSGYGSTYRANADSVTRYLFRYDTGDSSGWQNTPDNNMRYHQEGIYRPTLIVESQYTVQRDSDQVTITVGDVERGGWYSGIGTFWVIVGLLIVLTGGLFYFVGSDRVH